MNNINTKEKDYIILITIYTITIFASYIVIT